MNSESIAGEARPTAFGLTHYSLYFNLSATTGDSQHLMIL